MENFKNTINSLFDLFDRLSKADTSPTANYNMAEMFISRALKGNEKAKTTLASFISKKLNINYQIVEIALDEWINNKTNVTESRTMNKKLIRLTEGDLHRIVKKSVGKIINEAYRYNYNSQAKARAFEETISIIEKAAKKLQKMTNDESEFDGRAYDIGECATSILRLLDSYGFSDGGFNASDMADYESNPDYDTRNLGDYGTDVDGNWMYDENPDDEGYQYWLNNTRKGRKYARQNQ